MCSTRQNGLSDAEEGQAPTRPAALKRPPPAPPPLRGPCHPPPCVSEDGHFPFPPETLFQGNLNVQRAVPVSTVNSVTSRTRGRPGARRDLPPRSASRTGDRRPIPPALRAQRYRPPLRIRRAAQDWGPQACPARSHAATRPRTRGQVARPASSHWPAPPHSDGAARLQATSPPGKLRPGLKPARGLQG